MVGIGMSQVPQASHYALEQLVQTLLHAFFIETGYKQASPEQIALDSPSRQTLQQMTVNCAVNVLLVLQQKIKEAHAVYIGCDKSNRKDVDHLAKVLSFYNEKEQRVNSWLLDINGAGSSLIAAAKAIKDSISKKLGDTLSYLAGQSTDGGGGGVLHSLEEALDSLDLVDLYLYFVAPCTLHSLQLSFGNAVKAMTGEGGIGIRNAMQLVHACSDLQRCFPGISFFVIFEASMEQYARNGQSEDDVEVEFDTPSKHIKKAVLT